MSKKTKDEPHCGMTDLSKKMIERVPKRTMREEERIAIDAALSEGLCPECGHVMHDWLFAWFTPTGDIHHVCDGMGQIPRSRKGRNYTQIKNEKGVNPSWLLLDLVAYTLESP